LHRSYTIGTWLEVRQRRSWLESAVGDHWGKWASSQGTICKARRWDGRLQILDWISGAIAAKVKGIGGSLSPPRVASASSSGTWRARRGAWWPSQHTQQRSPPPPSPPTACSLRQGRTMALFESGLFPPYDRWGCAGP